MTHSRAQCDRGSTLNIHRLSREGGVGKGMLHRGAYCTKHWSSAVTHSVFWNLLRGETEQWDCVREGGRAYLVIRAHAALQHLFERHGHTLGIPSQKQAEFAALALIRSCLHCRKSNGKCGGPGTETQAAAEGILVQAGRLSTSPG